MGRPRRKQQTLRKPLSLNLERLEERQLLAIDATYSDGFLKIVGGEKDDIVITSQEGLVQINGANPSFGPLHVGNLKGLSVTPGSKEAHVDMSAVYSEKFSDLQMIVRGDAPVSTAERIADFAEKHLGENWQVVLPFTMKNLETLTTSPAWDEFYEEHIGKKQFDQIDVSAAQDAANKILVSLELPTVDASATLAAAGIAPVGSSAKGKSLLDGDGGSGGGFSMLSAGGDGGEGGTVTIQPLDATVHEEELSLDNDFATFKIKLDAEYCDPFTLDVDTVGISATEDVDYYAAHSDNQFHWGDSAEGGGYEIGVRIKPDNWKEPTETFEVRISDLITDPDDFDGPEGNATITVDSAVGTITDGDAKITIHDAQVLEGTGSGVSPMAFLITLSNPVVYSIHLDFAVTSDPDNNPGDATYVQDYSTPPTTQHVDFAPGQTEATLFVYVNWDEEVEGDEVFYVNPFGAESWDFADDEAVGTIIDDDEYIYVSVSDSPDVVEGDDPDTNYAHFVISLSSPALASGFTVSWNYRPGKAGPGDYTDPANPPMQPTSGSYTFLSGEQIYHDYVPIVADTIAERDEDFYIELHDVEIPGLPYRMLDPIGRALILDDDANLVPDPAPLECPPETDCYDSYSANYSTGDIGTSMSVGGINLSSTAGGDSRPIVSQSINYPGTPSGYTLDRVGGVLRFGKRQPDGTFEGDWDSELVYAPSSFSTNDKILFSMQYDDAQEFDPGAYDWTMAIEFIFRNELGEEQVHTEIRDGARVVANRQTLYNEFGGWSVSELDRLIPDPISNRIAWVPGSGYGTIFTPDGVGGFNSPDGRFEKLTFESGVYKLADPYGNAAHFDADGYLTKRVDRNGNEWVYTYTEADGDIYAELSTITDPFDRVTTFVYSGGVLSEILDHANRPTEVDIVGNSLTAIRTRDPDGTDPGANLVPLETRFSYSAGLIDAIHRPEGVSTFFAYDSAGRISRITHEDGTFIEIAPAATRAMPTLATGGGYQLFTPDVAVATVTNELGKSSHYKFDKFSQITEYIDELGHKTKYERNDDGLLTKLTTEDPAPGVERYPLIIQYDYDGRPEHRMNLKRVRSTNGVHGFVETWTYDDEFNLVKTHTDADGRKTGYVRDAAGNILEVRQAIWSLDNLALPAVDDLVTSYTYTTSGAAGLVGSITDPLGHVTEFGYLGSTGLVSSITYAVGTAVEATEEFLYTPVTLTLSASIDELGRQTDYVYDELDRLIYVIEPDPDLAANGDSDRPVWFYSYCACGRITATMDPEGTITTYQFDPQRGWLSQKRILSGDLEDQQNWSYDYDATGRLTDVTASQDRQTTYVYDDAGRVTNVFLPDPDGIGGVDRPEWEYLYDNVNLVIATIDPEGNRTDYEYDNLFRVEKVKLSGAGPEWLYTYYESGEVYSVTDPEGRTTARILDDIGRLVQVQLTTTSGTSVLAQYQYDAASNLRFSTDELLRTTERVYDERNRLVQLIEPDPDSPGSGLPKPITYFTYDDANNLKTLKDPNNNTTEWFYDGLNRPIEEQNELGASRFYKYDTLGRVTEMTDRLDRVTQYEYNHLSQLTSEVWKDSFGTTVRTIDYAYNGAALLEWVDDSGGMYYEFAYDGNDRLASVISLGGGIQFMTLEYGYDTQGNRTSLDVHRGISLDHTNAYVYDGLNRLTSVEQTGSTVANKKVEFTYLDDGRSDTITRSTGGQGVAVSDYNYNARGQLTSLVHDPAAAGEPNISHTYTYQANRVSSYTNIHGKVDYDYDKRDQLTSANWPSTPNDENYSYDEAGNRTVDGSSSYVVGANNRLVSDGTYHYGYDAEGNMVSRYVDADSSGTLNTGDSDVTLYSWDHRNRLTKVEHRALFQGANDQVITYLYDAFDRRTGRDLDSDGNGTLDRKERWVYDGREAILEFVDPDGAGSAAIALSKRFLNGPAVDQILAQEDLSKSIGAADRVLWHLSDSQGTVRDLVDNTGDLVEHYRYDAFGELIEIRDGANNVVTTPPKTNFLYNGMWRDVETGFYATDTRWYNPMIGRWMSEDPIGFGGGDENISRYAGNNPTNATDPTGLAQEPQPATSSSDRGQRIGGWLGGVDPKLTLQGKRPYRFPDKVFPGIRGENADYAYRRGCFGLAQVRLGLYTPGEIPKGIIPERAPNVQNFEDWDDLLLFAKDSLAKGYEISVFAIQFDGVELDGVPTSVKPGADRFSGSNQYPSLRDPSGIAIGGHYNYATLHCGSAPGFEQHDWYWEWMGNARGPVTHSPALPSGVFRYTLWSIIIHRPGSTTPLRPKLSK